jgi:hypothetical protein
LANQLLAVRVDHRAHSPQWTRVPVSIPEVVSMFPVISPQHRARETGKKQSGLP